MRCHYEVDIVWKPQEGEARVVSHVAGDGTDDGTDDGPVDYMVDNFLRLDDRRFSDTV